MRPHRSPDDVFGAIDDFSQTPRWLSSCEGIEKTEAFVQAGIGPFDQRVWPWNLLTRTCPRSE